VTTKNLTEKHCRRVVHAKLGDGGRLQEMGLEPGDTHTRAKKNRNTRT